MLTEQTDSWNGFLAWAKELNGTWCFRGQREADWSLSTSLDRAVRVDYVSKHGSGYYHLDRDQTGAENLKEFRRRARFLAHAPPEGDVGSWYAAMQHYGMATRFLDWTDSPFIAAYFAFQDEALDGEKPSGIWAIDLEWLDRRGRELLAESALPQAGSTPEERCRLENDLMDNCHKTVIIRVHPRYPNERMIAQRGILLCKLLHEAYFSVTLTSMMIHPSVPDHPVIRKLEIPESCRREFLTELETLSISRSSLFPA